MYERNTKNRFWGKVDIKGRDDCWLWVGSVSRQYGQFGYDYKNYYAHRFAWILTYGEIPKKLLVLHSCDVKICVNPNHLHLGTYSDNICEFLDRRLHN